MYYSLSLLVFCSNTFADSVLRSRAMMITGRLLSNDNAFLFIDEPSKIRIPSFFARAYNFLHFKDHC